MPKVEDIVSIPNSQIVCVKEGIKKQILAQYQRVPESCIHCKNSVGFRVKEHAERTYRHTMIGHQVVEVRLAIRKWKCKSCHRTFSDRVPGLLPRKRASERFRQEVFREHEQGISKKDLSFNRGISSATIERWYEAYISYRYRELSGRSCPKVLGIDEHFFSRKHGYATTLVDLRNHKVFDVVLGRSELSLRGYLTALAGREHVQVVVMDLSETYRSIVQKYFPNAKIVSDRFHVIRLLNHHFLKTYFELDPHRTRTRGLVKLMSKHEWNLKPKQQERIQKLFTESPHFHPLYEMKQHLAQILTTKTRNKQDVRSIIQQFLYCLSELKKTPLPSLQTLEKTLRSWMEPIARMWRFTKNNGITEGLHTKMELISRRAYGFRNFENYRRRVIALCGWNGVFGCRT